MLSGKKLVVGGDGGAEEARHSARFLAFLGASCSLQTGCASFVYSACHVEGYDIRAVHQDALQ